jgi:hypothetical protein
MLQLTEHAIEQELLLVTGCSTARPFNQERRCSPREGGRAQSTDSCQFYRVLIQDELRVPIRHAWAAAPSTDRWALTAAEHMRIFNQWLRPRTSIVAGAQS